MVQLTVREALRDAMAEEMRADPDVFLMGEEVAEYQGAYKVSQGLLDEFGAGRVIDTPITEAGFAGIGVGAAMGGLKPIVEFMTFQFRHAGDGSPDQLGREDALHVGRPAAGAGGVPRAQRRRRARRSPAFPVLRELVRPRARLARNRALFSGRCQGAAEGRHPRPQPGGVPGERASLRPELRGAGQWRPPGAHRQGGRCAPGQRCHRGRLLRSWWAGALEAAETLAGEGIEAEVIDLRSLRPLDADAVLASVEKTNRLVTVEEGWPFAGIGAEIAALVMERAFDMLDAPVGRVSGADVPMPYAANLEAATLPNAANIADAVRRVCYKN